MHWKVLDRHPDLLTHDFYVFRTLKKALKGGGDAMVPAAAQRIIAEGIHQLACQWDTYLNAHGEYY
jgi:hypothetical protein